MCTRQVVRRLLLFLIFVTNSGVLNAESVFPPVITMKNAIATTLQQNPEIKIEAQEVDISEGRLTTATGEFDWNFSAIFANEINREPGLPSIIPGGAAFVSETNTNITSYSVGLSRKLHNGIIINPNTNGTIFDDKDNPFNTSVSRGNLNFDIIIPLARGSGKDSAAANEASALKDHEASQDLYEHQLSIQIITTITAFWNCVAAKETLKILSQSEARALELEQTVVKLSNANLFSSAFVDQARSNTRAKQTLRVNEQLRLYKSRQALGIAMGLVAEEFINPPIAEGHFPDIKTPKTIDESTYSEYIALALGKRKDYLATQKSRDASYILREAARLDLRPRADLSLSFRYQGIDTGNRPFTQFANKDDGLSVFGAISLDFPFKNNIFKGRYKESMALTEQSTLLQLKASQVIASGVMVSMEEVLNSHKALIVSLAGEESSGIAVEKEHKRFTFGDTSLLDVIKLEDGYIIAQLNTIQAILNHVNALARLRFTTGTLMEIIEDHVSILIEQITEFPSL